MSVFYCCGLAVQLPCAKACSIKPHVSELMSCMCSCCCGSHVLSEIQLLDLAGLYAELRPGVHLYTICTVVCYYGLHYMAFVKRPNISFFTKPNNAAIVADHAAHVHLSVQASQIQLLHSFSV